MRNILFFIMAFALLFQSWAQRRQGSWKDYLSFSNAAKIAVTDSKVYCATGGGLFYFDRQDNSIQKFSGINGLSDFGIQTIAWNEANKVLLVAYKNSNIDLVYDSHVVNLPDIKRKQITGDKNIYNLSFSGSETYVSCGFGIVVLNLARQEVKDTYFIGEGGTSLRVNDVEVFKSHIYAATDDGLFRAEKNNPNLLNFRNWYRVENIPHAFETFNQLVVHAGDLLANYSPGENTEDELYRLNGSGWIRYLPEVRFTGDIRVNEEILIITSRSRIFLVDENHSIVGKLNSYRFEKETIASIKPRCADMAPDKSFWVADYEYGLVRMASEYHESVFPDGPEDNRIFSLYSNQGDLWVTPGGRDDSWTNIWQAPQFQLYREGQWELFSQKTFAEMDGFFDIVNIVADPADPQHIFVASWGGGILEFRKRQLINHFTNKNSPLETALPGQPDAPYVRIGGLDFDSQGNLWITNSEVAEEFVEYYPGGEWETMALPGVANRLNIGPLLVTQNDDKWILLPRGHDVYVVDKSGSKKKQLPVTSYFNNGENEIYNRMNDVYCIAEDLEGAIWIGTSKGVAVYNNPSRVWESEPFYAIQPGLDLNDGLYHPLLETETVTSIAVDGANRKWLGTRGAGIYLVSENGQKEILHFTSQNSPLLSNHITDVAINQFSGEVFIGTDEGLVSYQSDAIAGKKAFENVYVYPNPVRENHDGPVTVTGLIENTDIKITDISGNLVYQTSSLGGQAVWDGKNMNGKRVRTGVYLIFCNDENGEETHISKLLFIN